MIRGPQSTKALLIACACALVACAPSTTEIFRDPDAPLGATTRFDPLAFSGKWILAASFTPLSAGPVAITVAPEVAHLRISSDEVPQIAGLYAEGAPGELVPLSPRRDRLVVMWVDEDFETAAIGTAAGDFGAVLDRDGVIPEDRAVALRDIFDFYGWDVDRLKRTISWEK